MKQFNTLYEAVEFASTLSTGWKFATSDERYDKNSLKGIAEIHDEENPADEDNFYLVSTAGAIGYCLDGEDIDWLFLSDAVPYESLPMTYQAVPNMKFCPKCGTLVEPDGRFCVGCGEKLR